MKKSLILISILSILLTGCSNGSIRDTTTNNIVPITVDSGFNGQAYQNAAFITVTVCAPNTNDCQTIDHILLDTASTALRINASALNPNLKFPAFTTADNQDLFSCAQFGGGYDFGSVNKADIKIGGEIAKNSNFQIINNSQSQSGIPTSCSSTGMFNSYSKYGANGIIGFRNIVGSFDDGYYILENESYVLVHQQESFAYLSPAYNFAQDNNGIIIKFPPPPSSGATSLTGSLTFGLATRDNNQLANNAHIFYSTESNFGYIKTIMNGKSYFSYLDSGTYTVVFVNDTINQCRSYNFAYPGVYCPEPSPYIISVQLASINGANAINLIYPLINPESYINQAIAGNVILPNTGQTCLNCESFYNELFVWGMPFFYGKTVYSGFFNRTTPVGSGPFLGYAE